MPKWDIDQELRELEPDSAPGTIIQRAIVDVKLLTEPMYAARYGGGRIKPTTEEQRRGSVLLWGVGLGFEFAPKAFFYDRTIRGAFLQARKAAKLNKLAEATPWGRQAFTPSQKKAMTRGRQSSQSQTGEPAKRRGSR